MEPDDVNVTGICGSQREGSHTRKAIEAALRGAERTGADTDMVDPRNYDVRAFDPAAESDPGYVETLREADSIVLATPMYHGSYSSVIKSILDHCGFDEFEDKTVGLIGVSGGSFPITALEHLRSVCRALNAWVIPHQAAVPRSDSAFEDDEFVDSSLEDRVRKVGRLAVRFSGVGECDSFESRENLGGGR